MVKTVVDISVVVPVYNSSQTIVEFVRRFESSVGNSSLSYELILVDDCSADNSWEIIVGICQSKGWIKGLRLQANNGQWCASLVGMSRTCGKYIVTIDDDLEYEPLDILKLYQCIESNNYTVVFGMGKGKYLVRGKYQVIALGRNKMLNCFWHKPPTDSFKILRREFVFKEDSFLPTTHFEAYLNHHLDPKFIGYCSVTYNKRYAGSSNHSFVKKIYLFFLFTLHQYRLSSKKDVQHLIADYRN